MNAESNNMQFLITGKGQCTSCAQDVAKSDFLVCCSCSLSFHAVCTSVEKQKYLSTASFLKTYQCHRDKGNFRWFCDGCLTEFETSKNATIDNRIGHLVKQVTKMAETVNELSTTVSTLSQGYSSAPLNQNLDNTNNVWSNSHRTKSVRSSLLIKPVAGDSAKAFPDLGKIKDIAVQNKIQVSNFGKSKSGNTFIHCSTSADRDKLQPLLENNYGDREIVPLKEKSPHVTIVDIVKTGNAEVTTDTILSCIHSQNPSIAQLIDSSEELKVLFIKSNAKSDKCSAVVKLSCNIREAIRRNRNRIFIGITSCRVYDRFFVKRCNKCQEFGHYKENCTKADVCGYCSEDHPSEECTLKNETDLTLLKCANCKVKNLECSGHSTFWSKCPSYIIAQKRLKSTISYYDNHDCTAGHLND